MPGTFLTQLPLSIAGLPLPPSAHPPPSLSPPSSLPQLTLLPPSVLPPPSLNFPSCLPQLTLPSSFPLSPLVRSLFTLVSCIASVFLSLCPSTGLFLTLLSSSPPPLPLDAPLPSSCPTVFPTIGGVLGQRRVGRHGGLNMCPLLPSLGRNQTFQEVPGHRCTAC